MTTWYRAVSALALLALAAACSKSDPPPAPKPQAMAPAPAPAAPAKSATVSEPTSAEVDAALKERLARQEAAAKMFDRKPEPPKPEPRVEPKADAKGPSAAVPGLQEPPPPPPARPAEPPKVAAASPKAPEPAPPKAAEPTRAAEPKAEARPAPPPTTVAAAPATAPAQSGPPRVLTRVDPEFPREAVKAGADSGSVRARMTLDAGGAVTRVEIVEATPRRVFDRAVVQALSQWRFNEGAAGRTVETEVAFRR